MYQVYFEPDKSWWQFWKKDRLLVEGEDFEVTNGYFVTKKALKGKINVTYKLR